MPVRWRRFKNFSGPLVTPDNPVSIKTPVMDASDHWSRAFWLTSMVESGGRAGLVNMYDGCGATCGLHQAIAVLPRSMKAQGSLWKLLWRMTSVIPLTYYRLSELIAEAGWVLTGNGIVHPSDAPVDPRLIRDTLTPIEGNVPKSGERWEQAAMWGECFSEVFALLPGIEVQMNFGIEHFHASARRLKHNGQRLSTLIYNAAAHDQYPFLLGSVDLAVSMFWSQYVNGPSPARRALWKAYDKTGGPWGGYPTKFAIALIRNLGNNTYGRWDDDIPGGRYQRTREHAMKVWPKGLFGEDGVMPLDLLD